MKTEHTPGPWRTEGCAIYAGENRVAQTWDADFDGLPTLTMEANARMIAAAPELLEALEMALGAVEYFDEREGAPMLLDAVRAAIAKARGGAR